MGNIRDQHSAMTVFAKKHGQIFEKEGFDIFFTGEQTEDHSLYELLSWDEDEQERFATDDDARRFVVDKAIEKPKSLYGDIIRAFIPSPRELPIVFKEAVGEEKFSLLLKKLKITL